MDRRVANDAGRKRRKKIITLAGAGLLVLGAGYLVSARLAPAKTRWYPVVARDVSRVVSGRAVTVPTRIGVIAADSPGTVIEQRARVGDHLGKGDVLVVLKSTTLANELLDARQKLALAKARQQASEAKLVDEKMARQTRLLQSRNDMLEARQQARAKQALVKQGAVSRLDVSSAKLHAQLANEVYESGAKRLRKLEQAQAAQRDSMATEVRIAADTVEHLEAQKLALTVRAKNDGWLTRLNVTPGEHVSAGDVIAEMMSGGLYADVEIAQVDAPVVEPGDKVSLSSSVGTVNAVVQSVMPRATDGTVHVRAGLQSPPSWLRADMDLNARIHTGRDRHALYVKADPAFGERATRRVQRRAHGEQSMSLVHFGRQDGPYVEVLSGVDAGDRISPSRDDDQ